MANNNLLTIMQSKNKSPWEFNFDNMFSRPLLSYLTIQDIEKLKGFAMSIRLASRIKDKQKMIKDIMTARGFRRFAGGTNRIVFASYEDPSILIKVAVDRTGMSDNLDELKAQHLIKPFCCKMFDVSPCGTVGLCERVIPIQNKEQFKQIAEDVFEVIVRKIVGRYVMDDIGTDYFLNWGIRPGFGPVLVDYPYLYNTDGDKLYCNKILETGVRCSGEIDYDAGFNHLYCQKCGKMYKAIDLRSDIDNNKIVIGEYINGGNSMIVNVITDGKTTTVGEEANSVMQPKRKRKFGGLMINDDDLNMSISNDDNNEVKEEFSTSSQTFDLPDGFELEEDDENESSNDEENSESESKEESVEQVDQEDTSDDSTVEVKIEKYIDPTAPIADVSVEYNDPDIIRKNNVLRTDGNGNKIKTRKPTYVKKHGVHFSNRNGNPAQVSKKHNEDSDKG